MIKTKNNVVLAVAESDSHVVANRLIERYLKLSGYVVTNLGATTPISEIIDSANCNGNTIAIAIGSLNGHAIKDIEPLKKAKSKLVDKSIKVIVGGNLYTDVNNREENIEILKGYGVDRILDNHQSLIEYLNTIREAVGVNVPHNEKIFFVGKYGRPVPPVIELAL